MAYRRTDNVAARLADNRRAILNAARDLVAEGGFAAAQMTEVARKAGVATGTLYRYFPSKEELCRQVFREVSAREMNVLAGIYLGARSEHGIDPAAEVEPPKIANAQSAGLSPGIRSNLHPRYWT